jgi:hypothetical protein
VLKIWTEECERAGVGAFPERRTDRGAAILAERLNQAEMSPAQLRRGMRAMLAAKAAGGKYRTWDLCTLAGKPSEFVPPPLRERKKRRLVAWLYTCDACGSTAMTPYQAPGPTPGPQPCVRGDGGCQGTMRAEMAEGAG